MNIVNEKVSKSIDKLAVIQGTKATTIIKCVCEDQRELAYIVSNSKTKRFNILDTNGNIVFNTRIDYIEKRNDNSIWANNIEDRVYFVVNLCDMKMYKNVKMQAETIRAIKGKIEKHDFNGGITEIKFKCNMYKTIKI